MAAIRLRPLAQTGQPQTTRGYDKTRQSNLMKARSNHQVIRVPEKLHHSYRYTSHTTTEYFTPSSRAGLASGQQLQTHITRLSKQVSWMKARTVNPNPISVLTEYTPMLGVRCFLEPSTQSERGVQERQQSGRCGRLRGRSSFHIA